MRLHEVEPRFGPETVVPLAAVMRHLLDRKRATTGPFLLAIDGRSSNGKTSLATRITSTVASAAVVHTDDVGSHYSFFDWDHLLVEHIIEPLRRGESVAYRPPGYAVRTDPVEIVVDATAPLVVVEGVGAARANLATLVDAVIWVQSDLVITDERNRVRVEAGEMAPPVYEEWMAAEIAFQARERTWERADLIVCGTPAVKHDPEAELVVLGAPASALLGEPDEDPG